MPDRAPILVHGFVLLLATAAPALAQHAHDHDPSAAAVAQLVLDDSRKWPTDAPLRTGMSVIREAFEADHPAIHAGTESDGQYAALAARIQSQVDSIVANCRLPPAADAQLHLVIADLLAGASLMRGEDPARTRHDGAARVHGALRAYAEYFDDPGVTP